MTFLLRLHHVRLIAPLGAEPTARAFYHDLLGLAEIVKPAHLVERFGGLWFVLGADGDHGQLHVGGDPTATPIDATHTALQVTDAVALRQKLETAGARTEDAPLVAGWTRFYAWDPFGNKLELLQIDG